MLHPVKLHQERKALRHFCQQLHAGHPVGQLQPEIGVIQICPGQGFLMAALQGQPLMKLSKRLEAETGILRVIDPYALLLLFLPAEGVFDG